MDPYEKLCCHDPRNPFFSDDKEEPTKPRDGCFCDNCFYGRDQMALEMIRLRDALGKCAHDEWNRGVYGPARATVGDPKN